jgi:flagellar biosynthesis protein FlhG
LPGDSGTDTLYGLAAIDRARLHHRLSALYEGFDAVIVDSGPGIESVVRATMRARRLVVVSTPEPAALSDSYALIKIVTQQVPSLAIDVLANRVANPAEGVAVFERLALAADRFLRRGLSYLGAVPEDVALARRVREPGALLKEIPAALEELAGRLAERHVAPGRGEEAA